MNEHFGDFPPRVYRAVRAHGGLVIADEVETGLGRTGQHMWGFLR